MTLACGIQRKRYAARFDDGLFINLQGRVHDEVRYLLALMERTQTPLDEMRELITVPPNLECMLRAFCHENPEETLGIIKILEFRRKVAEEFERHLVK